MVGGLLLVFLDAAVELVGKSVDCRIHVGLGRVGVNLVPSKHQSGLGLVTQLLHREHAVNIDQLFEMPGDSLEFFQDIATKRRRNFHMMTAEIELHELPPELKARFYDARAAARFRSLDGTICMPSRYLATVRLATGMPSCDRISASLLSLNGFSGFSCEINLRILARMAVEDNPVPSAAST